LIIEFLFSLITLLGMLPLLISNNSGQGVVVTFRLETPDLPGDSTVYITGSTADLGNWNPGKVKMRSAGNHVWTYDITCQPGHIIEYKYTLGSWKHEGAYNDGYPLPNFSITARRDTVVNNIILNWTKDRNLEVSGQITGTVKYHRRMQGEGILPRDVIVWLPPDYDRYNEKYPVLYMHDGQNIIDPRTSAFGRDWEIDETCTLLIEDKAIPPLIVVGIYNTVDRGEEYVPGAKGTAYMKFIVEVLKPFIDKTYRTNPSRVSTFVGGSSAGGTCAFMLVWEYPGVFSKAMCMSPAFKYGSETPDSLRREGAVTIDYVKTVRESAKPAKPLFFYIDLGNDRVDKTLKTGVEEMLSALQEKGFTADRDYVFIYDKNAAHSETDWAKRFPDAIKLFFAK
jgi:predicted alpha/beta superfamily hydrolase